MIELLAAMALIAIVVSFGVPFLNQLLMNSRSTAALNSLWTNLHYARSEAIKRTRCITVIPAVAGAWESGWTVFVDQNCNSTNDNETRLRVVDSLNLPNVTLVPNRNDWVMYNSLGQSINVDGTPAENLFTFTVTFNGNNRVSTLSVSNTGQVRID